MLFTTNPSHATTLHDHLVADSVESFHDTLIRLLNTLVVSVCADTHNRLVTDVAEKQKAKSAWNDLPHTNTNEEKIDVCVNGCHLGLGRAKSTSKANPNNLPTYARGRKQGMATGNTPKKAGWNECARLLRLGRTWVWQFNFY